MFVIQLVLSGQVLFSTVRQTKEMKDGMQLLRGLQRIPRSERQTETDIEMVKAKEVGLAESHGLEMGP
jgi:hypothetical protein